MIRTRVAPSPTGHLHIGTVQSALYNWLFARKNNGKFLLRIEDTDKERSKDEYKEGILEVLSWLDLKFDEEPVIQSVNLPRHREMLEKLLKEGKAFYCHHTKEELEAEKKEQEDKKLAPLHFCSHKNDTGNKNAGGIIRLAVNENSDRIISFDDIIRGKVDFKESLLGDFAIARSIDDPLYHFAVAVDDADMEITHVLRGEDHISNTPKHILIFEALGFKIPVFAHLPLILAPDRSKLSKRHGDTSALAYKKDYLPEAVINFLGALGYTFSKEIISKEEMIKEFELDKVHRSGAVFDIKKLNWINSQYIKNLSPAKFKELAGLNIPDEAVPLITERLEKLTDAQNFEYLWELPSYDKGLLAWKKSTQEKSLETLKKVGEIIVNFNFEDKDVLRKKLDDLASEIGDRGLIYWPFRVALTGKERSPDPVDVAFVLGKEKTLERVKNALG
jgi:glutamyl-tRNA synthetase